MTGAALTILAIAPAWAAHAAPEPAGAAVEEVIVTATKTGETNLQKTALSVAVVGGQELLNSNIRNIKDLTLMVPSLVVTTNNVNPQIYVRGVGGAQGLEGDVSIYFDGVYLSRPSVILQTNFNDIERVEVLEGPQGTGFGRNSTGGAINFISKAPSKTFTFNNTLQIGNYSLFDEAFSVSGPLTDKLQARLSFSHVQHSGYLTNVNPAVGGHPDAANRSSVRATVRWEPSDNISNTVRADYLYVHEQWATNDTFLSPTLGITWSEPLLAQIQGQYDKVDIWSVPYQTEKAFGLSNEFSWKLNDNLILKSQSAVRTDFSDNRQDGLTSDRNKSGFSRYVQSQYSQEFNIINNYGPLSGVFGVYYFRDLTKFTGVSLNYGGNLLVPNPAGGRETFQITRLPVESKAVFFEETYHFTPELSLTLGARYTKDHKRFDTQNSSFTLPAGFPVGFDYLTGGRPFTAVVSPIENPYIRSSHVPGAKPPLSSDGSATTPRASVNWQITPDALLYVSTSRGFKSGGFSPTARQDRGASFGPEKLTAYELGAKTDWLEHTLRVNLTLFRYDWTGQQFTAQVAPQFTVVANAGASRTNGLEANIIWKPVQNLILTASTTLLDSQYTDFPAYTFPAGFRPLMLLAKDPNYNSALDTYDAKGKHLVNAPNVSMNITAQKNWKLAGGGDVFLRGEWSHTSRMFFDPTNIRIASRPPTRTTNASAGYTPANANWDFAVWVKNIEGERYVNGIYATGTITAPVTAPRTFGVRVNYQY
jgi:iron complex outermembrane receptor protein